MGLACLCVPESFKAFSRAALIVGHPGHELKVFGWMSEFKPRVYALTDGSGRHGTSRLPSTRRLLSSVAAETGDLFGIISDRDLYRALLTREIPWFLAEVDRLAESLIEARVDFVAADAIEGFNPTHDICRTLVDAAVVIAKRKSGRSIANYEFCLTEWEGQRAERHDGCCLHYGLDDAALSRKIEAAENYTELKGEVERAIALRGRQYFRIECLKRIAAPFQQRQCQGRPEYESWGERRVAEGTYSNVIRYEEHVLPIFRAIQNHANRNKALAVAVSAYPN